MKFSYQFSNLCGTVYKKGNVVFTADGNSVISPVGNRVSVFDLVRNKSYTLPFENVKDITRLCLSPNGVLLISVDEDGKALLINLRRRALLSRFNFKAPVRDIKFSPDGRYFAVTHKKQVHVWHTPGSQVEFAPFALHRRYTGHYEDVTCICWSHDSRFFVTGSVDATCRVYTLNPLPGYKPVTLTAHRDKLINVFFANNSLDIYSVSKDGTLLHWHHDTVDRPIVERKRKLVARKRKAQPADSGSNEESDGSDSSDGGDEDGETQTVAVQVPKTATVPKWYLTKEDKHYFLQDHAKVVCATLHVASSILVVGFTSGVFALYELPDFTNIHTLSISQKRITTVSVNSSGEWLAFGSAKLGQLLVWEWQSETYVLKQQGHFFDMNVLAHAPSGNIIATGGDDAKVKLWNTSSGFCYVTFKEHSAAVTGVAFAQSGLAVVSSSLDGTVRAFDLVRYRNFRTFVTPHPVQLSCLALDPSGEIVCAGAQDSFDIFMWSMQTGKLLEIITGHEGPISALSFHPTKSLLASTSWDKTLRMWDVFGAKSHPDVLSHGSDAVALSFRPDGEEVAVSTLDGQLSFWDASTGRQVGSISGRLDIIGGRLSSDQITAKNSSAAKCFTSIGYTADGTCLLAGGRTKYVCIYQVAQKVLLKRFCISNNQSLEGMRAMLNSKNMTEAGPRSLIDDDSESDVEDRLDHSLPGVTKGDFSFRKVQPEIRTKCVQFSPTGRAWAAASTEGLLIYSLDDRAVFDPYDLDLDVSPESLRQVLAERDFIKALVIAFRLNLVDLIQEVTESVPVDDIQLLAQNLPRAYLERFIVFLATQLEGTRHLEFYLRWCQHVLNAHGVFLKEGGPGLMTAFWALQKATTRHHETLSKLCDGNKYMLEFLDQAMHHRVEEAPLGALEDKATVTPMQE
eukprot:m.198012 g.198012  ORF g.198012 m.198012 type:complete len:909 (+) comp18362_c0_seq2:64-2790(+)